KHQLDGSEVRAVLQQVRREGMPQYVRGDVRPDSGLPRVLHDLHPERLTRHRTAAIRQKKMDIIAAIEMRAGGLDVGRDRLAGCIAERNDALLRSFAERAQKPS